MHNPELFETLVDRRNDNSLKTSMLPEEVKEKGLQSFWGAEFCFPTCPAFVNGVIEFTKRGSFPFIQQNPVYNRSVKWWMKNVRDWDVEEDWIVSTNGTIFGLATAIRMFCSKEKALLMFTPGYYRYKQAADRMGFPTVTCALAQNGMTYSLDMHELEKCLQNNSVGLIVLNNPNNPTGTIFDEASLRSLDEISRKYQIPVYSDEIFAEIVTEGNAKVVPFSRLSGEQGLSMTCTSLGKCMSLTGVNHANVIIPNKTLREAYIHQKYSDHYGSIDPFLHAGLLAAYTEEGEQYIEDLCEVTTRNARYFIERLHSIIPEVKAQMPQGTYVVWVDYSSLGLSDEELENLLHKEALFLGDPGSDYLTSSQYYRYCITMPLHEMEKCFEKLEEAVNTYRKIQKEEDNYENH